ncbi:hypothetical protein C8J57DRAFT_1535464 [Mycena rebaudengoi]|nr:hypothetical protein C8J57DRAFT_1535464 [Mycena rebaudengoi]
MPIFSSTSHVHINGGSFIEIGRDFNLQSIQPPGSVDEVLTGPESRVSQDSRHHLLGSETNEPSDFGCDSGRQLIGAERTRRRRGPRMSPNDTSRRRQMISHSNESSSFPPTTEPTSSSYDPARQCRQLQFHHSSTADRSDKDLLDGRHGRTPALLLFKHCRLQRQSFVVSDDAV